MAPSLIASGLSAAGEAGSLLGAIAPLFDENTLSSVIWTTIIFGILVAVLAVYAWPKILEALQEREKRIAGTIQEAEEKRRASEAQLEKYNKQLEEARVDAQKIIEEGKADAEAMKRRYLDEQHREAETLKRRTLHEIELARDKALADLQEKTVDLSLQVASRLIEKNLSRKDQKKLIDQALKEAEAAARD